MRSRERPHVETRSRQGSTRSEDLGCRAFVRVTHTAGGLRSKTFGPSATITTMKQWRENQRVDARRVKGPTPNRGTLAADIEDYLALVAAMPTIAWRTRDLYAWREVFGDLSRSQISSSMIREQLHRWRTVGPRRQFSPKTKTYRDIVGPLSASACNHRRTALLHLWTLLDGRGAPNPVKNVPAFQEPAAEPRGRDVAFLAAAIDRMQTKAQQARARVLLWTGMRGNSELAKMKREHVDLEAGLCHVPTGKGGRKFRTVTLNANGVAAWQAFIDLKLWGPYDKNLMLKSFRRACRSEAKARQIPMPRVRVYDLRHSFATAYLKQGADLADVQELLGHTTSRMTRRYAPFQHAKLAAVGKTLELPDDRWCLKDRRRSIQRTSRRRQSARA